MNDEKYNIQAQPRNILNKKPNHMYDAQGTSALIPDTSWHNTFFQSHFFTTAPAIH